MLDAATRAVDLFAPDLMSERREAPFWTRWRRLGRRRSVMAFWI
jgi:hypothetical protein